ncbi:MAG TPA: hypothetical protein VGH90_04565, partial [Chthoniobacteraceae bacterium]
KVPPKFTTIESIAAAIPDTDPLKSGGKWNVVALDKASDAVSHAVLQHPAQLHVKIAVLEPYKEDGWGYRIMAPDDHISIRGAVLPYRIWIYFRPEEAESLIKLHKGSMITVSGTLNRADIKMYGNAPTFSIDLTDAKVEPSPAP